MFKFKLILVSLFVFSSCSGFRSTVGDFEALGAEPLSIEVELLSPLWGPYCREFDLLAQLDSLMRECETYEVDVVKVSVLRTLGLKNWTDFKNTFENDEYICAELWKIGCWADMYQ